VAEFWNYGYISASGQHGGAVDAGKMLWAATSAAPYVARLGYWDDVVIMLNGAFRAAPADQAASQVLDVVTRLRPGPSNVPAGSSPDDAAQQRRSRENLLKLGRDMARRLSRWDDHLELGATLDASLSERGASPAEIAQSRVWDYLPLFRTGRADALAALRHSFRDGDGAGVAFAYHILGDYIAALLQPQPERVLGCYLAAALLRRVTGDNDRASRPDPPAVSGLHQRPVAPRG
jgi:hypothetical protein